MARPDVPMKKHDQHIFMFVLNRVKSAIRNRDNVKVDFYHHHLLHYGDLIHLLYKAAKHFYNFASRLRWSFWILHRWLYLKLPGCDKSTSVFLLTLFLLFPLCPVALLSEKLRALLEYRHIWLSVAGTGTLSNSMVSRLSNYAHGDAWIVMYDKITK